MQLQQAIFGAGCFWHVEHYFSKIKGVKSTSVGYSGGNTKNPKYSDVCTGLTGHIEVVKVIFDTKIITYDKLVDHFWKIHDPCSLDKQGPDVGTQYKSVIFATNTIQKEIAIKSKRNFNLKKYNDKIVTIIEILKKFYRAEEYHQKYIEKNQLSPNNVCK